MEQSFLPVGLAGGWGLKNRHGWVDTLEAYQYACGKLESLELEQNPQMSVRIAIPISRVK